MGRADIFGSALAAISVHGTSGALGRREPAARILMPTLKYQLDHHFDALATAATASNAVLQQLVDTTTAQYAEMADSLHGIQDGMLAANTADTSRAPPDTPAQCVDAAKLALYQKAIQNKWVIGDFCLMHGWGVGEGHTSAKYWQKAPGHVNTATRDNLQGPGAALSPDWDAGLRYSCSGRRSS